MTERLLGRGSRQGPGRPAPYGIWRSEGATALGAAPQVATREVDVLPDLERALQDAAGEEGGNPAGKEGLLG